MGLAQRHIGQKLPRETNGVLATKAFILNQNFEKRILATAGQQSSLVQVNTVGNYLRMIGRSTISGCITSHFPIMIAFLNYRAAFVQFANVNLTAGLFLLTTIMPVVRGVLIHVVNVFAVCFALPATRLFIEALRANLGLTRQQFI